MSSELVRVFKAFSDENRVEILKLLCGEKELCACVLLHDLRISQPTLSHHMKILCASGIVTSRREGRWNYYSINRDGCEYGRGLLKALMEGKLEEALFTAGRIHRVLHPLYVLFGGRGREMTGTPEDGCCGSESACCGKEP